MTPKRNRTLNASAGLLTALTVGVATLAGCAPFDPNPSVGGAGAQLPTTTPSSAPASTGTNPGPGPGVTPTTAPTAPPVAAVGRDLKLNAMIGTTPLANATLKAFDVATGKPLSLVSAGGLNLTTDAQGNLTTKLPIAEGQVVRLVVGEGKGKTLTSVVAGGQGGALSGMGLTNGSIALTEGSTVATSAMSGMFQLAANAGGAKAMRTLLQTQNRAALLRLLDTFFARANELSGEVNEMPQNLRDRLMNDVDNTGEISNTELAAVLDASPEFKTAMTTVATAALQSYAAAEAAGDIVVGAALPASVAADLEIFTEVGFAVNFTDGDLKVTGNGVNITVETPEPTEPDSTPPPAVVVVDETPTSTDEELDSDGKTIDYEGGNFTPSVSLTRSGSTLTMRVSQIDEDGVKKIIARIPRATTGAAFSAPGNGSNLATGTVTGGAVGPGLSSGSFQVVRDDSATEPGTVSGASFQPSGSVAFKGYWNDGGQRVATVAVYQSTDFVTLVIEANQSLSFNSNASVNDHTTSVSLSSFLTLDNTKLTGLEGKGYIDLYLEGQNGGSAVFKTDIDVSSES